MTHATGAPPTPSLLLQLLHPRPQGLNHGAAAAGVAVVIATDREAAGAGTGAAEALAELPVRMRSAVCAGRRRATEGVRVT